MRHFCTIDNSQRRVGRKSNIKVSNKAKFLLPCLIIATYLAFNSIANAMFLCKYIFMEDGHAKSLVSEILHLFWILGHLCDAFLYICLQKSLDIFKKRKIESVPATREINRVAGVYILLNSF